MADVRILMLANARSPHTGRWATGLAGRGHEVHVVSIRGCDLPGVVVHRIGIGGPDVTSKVAALVSYLMLWWSIPRLVSRLRPDIVNAHYATTHGVIARRIDDVPVVLTVWGSDLLRGDRAVRGPARLLARRALRHARVVTSAGRFMARAAEAITSTTVDVRLVPFGVDTELFVQGEESERDFTIGFTKAFRPRYAPEVLLEAFERFAGDSPRARLVMAGEGPLRGSMMDRALRAGLVQRVSFPGRLATTEVARLLGEVDVAVNPSRSESFGVAILEASACRVPVIATAVGGVAETVIDGVTGLLIPVDDVDALVEALRRLERDPAERARMGEAGRRMVVERFRWDDSLDAMLRIFDEVGAGDRS